MYKNWVIVCLINFLVAALMGVMMRLANVVALNIDPAKLIHAHSHTAMLGWVYLMLYSLFVHHFVPMEKQKRYNTLFWLTQLTVVGMMISFPIQGYALFSITFSTLHIVCSYFFCFRIWKDNDVRFGPARLFLYTAMVFMLVSTLGAWSVGIVTNIAGKDSPLYHVTIQFFLHFQFNGWFVFAVLSVFFDLIGKHEIVLDKKLFKLFYLSLVSSAVLTFALPVSWHFPSKILFYLNILGIALQLLSLIYFIRLMQPHRRAFFAEHSGAKWLLGLSLVSFAVKITVQAVTMFPVFAEASHAIRNFTVGFIHLGMLGVITGFLFFFVTSSGFSVKGNAAMKMGFAAFYSGFLLTESLLFYQGMRQLLRLWPMPLFPEILFAVSLLLPVGLAFIIAGVGQRRRYDFGHI
jgi:hypothetical protein